MPTDGFYSDLETYRGRGDVKGFYAKWAAEYDDILIKDNLCEVNNYAASKLAKYVEVENPVILDVACGTGLSGQALKEAGFLMFDGIDASSAMIKKADEKQIYRNLQVGLISETDKLAYEGNTYDGVICISGITKDHIMVEHVLRDFLRVIKPGGFAVYTINDFNDEGNFLEEHGKVMKDNKCELILIERRFYYTKDGKDTVCFLCMIKVL